MENSLIQSAHPLKDVDLTSYRYEVNAPRFDFSCREPAPVPYCPNLFRLFSDQVKATPGQLAVQDAHDQYSYVDLDKRVTQIAAVISRVGVEHEDVIAICIDRSAELVAAILAVLKVGASFILFDNKSALARQRSMLQASAAKILLGSTHSIDALKQFSECLSLESTGEFIAVDRISRQSKEEMLGEYALDDQLAQSAYYFDEAHGPSMLHFEHTAFLQVITRLREELPAYRFRSMLSTSSVYQSRFTVELFFALLSGITINFADEEVISNPFALNATLKRTAVDVVFAPNDALRGLVDAEVPISSKLMLVSYCDLLCEEGTIKREEEASKVLYYVDRLGSVLCSGLKYSEGPARKQADLPVSLGLSREVRVMGLPRAMLSHPAFRGGDFISSLSSETSVLISADNGFVYADGVKLYFNEIQYWLEQHPAVEAARVEKSHGGIRLQIDLSESYVAEVGTNVEVDATNLTTSAYPESNLEKAAGCIALSARLNDYLLNNLVVSFHPDCYIFTS
jgi:hypothetical protein